MDLDAIHAIINAGPVLLPQRGARPAIRGMCLASIHAMNVDQCAALALITMSTTVILAGMGTMLRMDNAFTELILLLTKNTNQLLAVMYRHLQVLRHMLLLHPQSQALTTVPHQQIQVNRYRQSSLLLELFYS